MNSAQFVNKTGISLDIFGLFIYTILFKYYLLKCIKSVCVFLKYFGMLMCIQAVLTKMDGTEFAFQLN